MSYSPTTWVTGDIVTATKLNNMENGIDNNDEAIAALQERATEIESDITKIGDLIELTTTDKSDLVGAINEVDGNVDALAEDVSDLNTALSEKADQDGYCPDMTVGTAEQLLSDETIESQVPYNFKQTPDVGNREYLDAVVGGTVAWNQLVQNGNFADTSGWTALNCSISASNNILCLKKASGSSVDNFQTYRDCKLYADHIYLYVWSAYTDLPGTKMRIVSNGQYPGELFSLTTSMQRYAFTYSHGSTINSIVNLYSGGNSGVTDEINIYVKDFNIIDLTTFNRQIANYVHTLEQATAGAGVAWLKSHGFLTKDYYAYNAGSLESVQVSEHRMTGKNLLNVSAEPLSHDNVVISDVSAENGSFTANASGNFRFIIYEFPVKKNANYTLSLDVVSSTYKTCFFITDKPTDSQMTVIVQSTEAAGARHVSIIGNSGAREKLYVWLSVSRGDSSGAGNTAVLSHLMFAESDAESNFEPYKTWSYPIKPITLRGIPKLDANNELYYDGDRYLPDGTVQRRYGIVDLGTLDFEYMSGGYFQVYYPDAKGTEVYTGACNAICTKYVTSSTSYVRDGSTEGIAINSSHYIFIRDSAYTDAATFKTAMSGVYLVYELATPTTESADPYTNLQVCEAYGTEAFTDAGQRDVEIPAGNETRYSQNLTKKIEGLPWDLSLIAPIENGTTASQAYIAGQYFLKDDQFCKALASIASGATFTLGTNYSVTTVAAELFSALSS